MRLCAAAARNELVSAIATLEPLPRHHVVRAPETGLVMLRGRAGGDGAPFNLGEATVTRAAVGLESGETGFACMLGRDPEKARLAALCDALVQTSSEAGRLWQAVEPIRRRVAREDTERNERTAATRVDFFTLVRGEDTA